MAKVKRLTPRDRLEIAAKVIGVTLPPESLPPLLFPIDRDVYTAVRDYAGAMNAGLAFDLSAIQSRLETLLINAGLVGARWGVNFIIGNYHPGYRSHIGPGIFWRVSPPVSSLHIMAVDFFPDGPDHAAVLYWIDHVFTRLDDYAIRRGEVRAEFDRLVQSIRGDR